MQRHTKTAINFTVFLFIDLTNVVLSLSRSVIFFNPSYLPSRVCNTFNVWFYGVGHVVKDHSGKERGNPLSSLHELLFLISSHFLFQPVLDDWCNKGCGMCYPVCRMVHIKDPLLLIKTSSPCCGSRFPLLLSEWSITICSTPYNHK